VVAFIILIAGVAALDKLPSKSKACDYVLQDICQDDIKNELGVTKVLKHGKYGKSAGEIFLLSEKEEKALMRRST
jgi:hypothetical protein